LTTSRRPSPATRATRRSRRPAPRSTTFLERNRTALLWLIGALVLAVLLFVGFVLPATTPAFSCDNEFSPTPAPSWVAPTPAPVGSGATPAPAVTPPPPGYVQPDMGHVHETNVSKPIRYTWCPPASGRHYNANGFGPIPGKLYGPDEKTTPGGWIHNLEHGAIVLLYSCKLDPDACTESGQQALADLLARWPNSPICNFPPGTLTPIITRFDDMSWPFAALVWDLVLPMQTIDEPTLFDFYARQAERFNPEPKCAQPTPTPEPTPTAGPTGTPVPSAVPSAAPTVAPTAAPTTAPTAEPS
jgi:hypothetical protein